MAQLVWFRETYEINAVDAAQTTLMRFFTPDGMIHDAPVCGKASRYELWRCHRFQVWVLSTTTGLLKHGVFGELALASDDPRQRVALPTVPWNGAFSQNHGLRYDGAPFLATHGVGWVLRSPAVVDTDKVAMALLYEVVK